MQMIYGPQTDEWIREKLEKIREWTRKNPTATRNYPIDPNKSLEQQINEIKEIEIEDLDRG
jgi:hypothetical protein